MFHPVGNQPPSVYWRRRVVFFASLLALLLLLILTVRVLASGDSKTPAAASGTTSSALHPSTTPASVSSSASSTEAASHSSSPDRSTSGSASRSSSAAPKPCSPSSLALAAVTSQSSYSVGAQPVVSIQVTNKSSVPCVVDLADPQIVLRVYNGESRVWGSHDCKIEPGTDDRTLMAGQTVKVSIVWTGLSSEPHKCSNRQRVGAGTYTLYASLSGHEGKAAQFTIK